MAADVATSLKNLSTSEASNAPAGATTISNNLDDNLRMMQAVMRQPWSRATVASAGTTDIGANDAGSFDITGAATITAFGTVSAGIRKWLRFVGGLTLTHNATSLILPTAANITTAADDVCLMESLGSGNWRCLSYLRANGQTVALSSTFSDGTVSLPGMAFTSDTDTGFYRIGANNFAMALGGVKYGDFSAATFAFTPSTSFTVNAGGGVYSFAQALSLRPSGVAVVGSADAGLSTSDVTVASGTSSAGGNTGTLTLATGDTTTPGSVVSGNVVIKTGATNASTSTGSGDITITAGSGASGGDVAITAGQSTGAGSTGGSVTITSRTGSATPGPLSLVSPAVVSITGTQLLMPNTAGTPAISSGGGAGASVSGGHMSGAVTMGTGSPTTVTLGPFPSFASPPRVFASTSQSGQALHVDSTTTTVTISSSTAFSSGTKVNYFIVG